MGPYVFREKRIKENIQFFTNDTVSYNERKIWFFDSSKSVGNLHDRVTSAHVITATVVDRMRDHTPYEKNISNFMLNYEGGHLAVSKPAGDWILEGFQDKLIDLLRFFNTSEVPHTKFGWFVERNNSLLHDGSFTVYTGVEDITKLGQLTHWNGRAETGFFAEPCDSVKGAANGIFPPHLNPKEDITVFVIDACRFMVLKPKGIVHRYGLNATKWVATEETLDSGETDSTQKCFCNVQRQPCPKKGVVDSKRCRAKAPIYASFPHFYLADKSYRQAITGMYPNPEKHHFVLIVDPKTGMLLELQERLQINMMIRADNDFE